MRWSSGPIEGRVNHIRCSAEPVCAVTEEDDQVHGPSRCVVTRHLTRAQAWFELRDLLNSWDPIGIYDPETAFPADEYDYLYVT